MRLDISIVLTLEGLPTGGEQIREQVLGLQVEVDPHDVTLDADSKELEAATRMGATHTVDSSATDPVTAIQELTGGHGASESKVSTFHKNTR